MLSLDTTFLVHLWRHRNDESHSVHRFVQQHPGEAFVVPVMAAGEFLEGAAYVSEDRLEDAARFLTLFQFGEADLETARSYARVAADLRHRRCLAGMSKTDIWIAAWSLQHGAVLATQNTKPFRDIEGLELASY